jgi:hypothetical protein
LVVVCLFLWFRVWAQDLYLPGKFSNDLSHSSDGSHILWRILYTWWFFSLCPNRMLEFQVEIIV